VLEAAAQGLGVAFMHFVLFDNISNVSERLKDISRELELDRACDQVAEACRQLCKASHCHVFMVDDRTGDMLCTMSNRFRIPGSHGIPGAVRKRGGTQFYNSLADLKHLSVQQRGAISRTGSSYCTEDMEHHLKHYDHEYDGLWNGVGVPMIDSNGRIVGVIELGNKIGRLPFTAQDERLIKVIASHAYTTMKHCLTYEATVAKVEANKGILLEVVGLVHKIAASLSEVILILSYCLHAGGQGKSNTFFVHARIVG
jgi:GAF domain-containing protein